MLSRSSSRRRIVLTKFRPAIEYIQEVRTINALFDGMLRIRRSPSSLLAPYTESGFAGSVGRYGLALEPLKTKSVDMWIRCAPIDAATTATFSAPSALTAYA